jgi:hypothetical protein
MSSGEVVKRILQQAASLTLSTRRHVSNLTGLGTWTHPARTLGTSAALKALISTASQSEQCTPSRSLSTKSPPGGEDAGLHDAEPGTQTLSIDRSGLFRLSPHNHDAVPGKEPETAMAKHIKALIQVGPNACMHAGKAAASTYQLTDLSSCAVPGRPHHSGGVHVGARHSTFAAPLQPLT